MPIYKCPSCGRSNIDIPMSVPAQDESSTVTLPSQTTEVHCKDCGWFGPVEELKVGH